MRSLYGILAMVVVCCVALSTVSAAPNFAVIGQETNELLARSNGTDNSEDNDANPFTVAWLIAKYGCMFAKYTAIACRFLRSGEIMDEAMLVGRLDDEDLDQIDWNEVRRVVKDHGCPVIKAVAFACRIIG